MMGELSERPEVSTKRELINRAIPVDRYIKTYDVKHPFVQETLKEFPVLNYLLDAGMFGLKNSEEATKWNGIFNHIMGASRHVYYLADRIAHATPEQKKKLITLGYSPSSLQSLDTELLRDHKFIDHSGRRRADEERQPGKSEQYTMEHLKTNGADRFFLNHMKEEDHVYLLEKGKSGRLKDIQYAVLTYGDWTFSQKPVNITERFEGLRKSGRLEPQKLDELEKLGLQFESDLKSVFGDTIIDTMMNLLPYSWEAQIRKAYNTSAGL